MKPILHLLRLLLLICLLSIKGQAQDGPVCTAYQKSTGLPSFARYIYADGSTVYAADIGLSGQGGLGISTDGGKSFDIRTKANSNLASDDVRDVFAVGNKVYAATTAGLSISTDGGISFTPRNAANNLPGAPSGDANGVFAVGNTVYVTIHGYLFVSTNGGDTFVNKGNVPFNPSDGWDKLFVLGNTIYLTSASGFCQSTNGGDSYSFLIDTWASRIYAVGDKVYVATHTDGLYILTKQGTGYTYDHKTAASTNGGLIGDRLQDVFAIGNTIYVAIDEPDKSGLSISTNGGNSFTTVVVDGDPETLSVKANNNTMFVSTVKGVYSFADAALPVKLVSFTGGWQAQQGAVLSWQTAWEKTNDHFEIQRSTDAKSFESIGRVAGKGTQQATTDYAFTDTQMPGELAYYRLKQVDTDATHTYSSIISVRRGLDTRPAVLRINPNPAQKTLVLNLSAGQLKTVRIFDLAGRLIQSASVLTPDVSALRAGSYLVEVTTAGGQVLKQRFVKE